MYLHFLFLSPEIEEQEQLKITTTYLNWKFKFNLKELLTSECPKSLSSLKAEKTLVSEKLLTPEGVKQQSIATC